MPTSDEELFGAFVNGDNSAFENLVKRYEKKLYGFLVRYTGDANLAEDIFQETFVKVFEKRHLYCPDKPFQPWLYCIATNTAKDKFRERKHSSSLAEREADTNSPECEVNRKEIGEMISRAISRLPEVQRQVFILREYENLSYADISTIVRRPINTVKSDMRRALNTLRGLLESLASVAGGD